MKIIRKNPLVYVEINLYTKPSFLNKQFDKYKMQYKI
jgi:hypothetical protein